LGGSLPAGRQGIFTRPRFSAAAEFRANKTGPPPISRKNRKCWI